MFREHYHPYKQKVVTIGGGGGSNMVLRGLTQLNSPECNSAVVGDWDDGGKSGITRLKEGVASPGDLFMALYGLMEGQGQSATALHLLNNREMETMMRDILLVQAERHYHSIEAGIDALRRLFRISGNLALVSSQDLRLFAETRNGKIIEGERKIDKREEEADFDPSDVTSSIFFNVQAQASDRALQLIKEAQKVIIVPGSPYTSIFPHLLVEGIQEAIMATNARLIVVPNLTTTRGEDHHLDRLSRWLKEFQFLLGDNPAKQRGRSRIDKVVINNRQPPPGIIESYLHKGQHVVAYDKEICQDLIPGTEFVELDLLDDEELRKRLIRHESVKLAKAILEI